MSNVNTYTGLNTAILEWSNRTDTVFINNIPLFISLAEQQFFIDCSTLGNETYITGTFNANSGIVNKPALWGRTLTFSYLDATDNIHVLQRSSYEMIRSYIPKQSVNPVANIPRYYTDYGYNYFLISPTPVAAYNFEICYFQKIQPLSLSNETNWITENAYDALFWSSMNKAMIFIDNMADAEMYKALYQERVTAINAYNDNRLTDRTANISGGLNVI